MRDRRIHPKGTSILTSRHGRATKDFAELSLRSAAGPARASTPCECAFAERDTPTWRPVVAERAGFRSPCRGEICSLEASDDGSDFANGLLDCRALEGVGRDGCGVESARSSLRSR